MTQFKLSGKVAWKSPSNIALVKYWGKYGRQLPRNPSISFTLHNACSKTSIEFDYNNASRDDLGVEFYFEGQKNEAFKVRILKYLNSLAKEMPFLQKMHLQINSSNSFPHSSGIASSASSMSALVLGLISIEEKILNTKQAEKDFYNRASYFARLASGSACRSVYPAIALWGRTESFEHSSDEYAIPLTINIHPEFLTFHDDILIVSDKKKSISSSAGHQLMESNVFATSRYMQAHTRINSLKSILAEGDLFAFGQLVEDEALTLHALMMCSHPSYILMKPGTLSIIEDIRSFREDTEVPVFFSLDAGPNIHLLYPDKYQKEVSVLKDSLKAYCFDRRIIEDHVGQGPELLIVLL